MHVAGALGVDASAAAAGAARLRAAVSFGLKPHNTYVVECRRADGTLRWREVVDNLVTTEGGNDLLTKYLKGSGYTAAWYVGLVSGSSPTFAAGDVAAQIGGTNGWTEFTAYSESVRQTATFGSASGKSIDNSASKATFSINGSGTIGGAFLASTSTKSGTTGVLFGEAAFGTARSVISGDTLNVTMTNTV